MPNKGYVISVGPSGQEIGYTWRAPDDLYDPIKTELGIVDLSAFNGVTVSGRTGSFVPRLRIYGEDSNGKGKSFTVFCDPSKYEDSLSSLRGKTVRGYTIRRVKFPKKRVFV